jgi:hypothetical protein
MAVVCSKIGCSCVCIAANACFVKVVTLLALPVEVHSYICTCLPSYVFCVQVPDYHLIIKRPMDFGKMRYKLNMLEYRNNSEFIADALLVFENCQMYNQVDAQEYK